MKKEIAVLWLTLTMFFSFFVIHNEITLRVEASTLYVGGTGPGNYTSIHAAIADASDGDTLFVYSGTYYENIVVDKRINLTGENRDNTIIDGDGSSIVIHVNADEVNITRFTLTNGLCGIYLDSSLNINISENNLINNGIFIGGDEIQYWNTHNIDNLNTVNGKPVYYWKDKTGGIIPSGAGQVILANCTNVKIESQELTLGSFGVGLGFSTNNSITDNNASSNNYYGIYLYYSNMNYIIDNEVISNRLNGIRILSSSNNTISDNNIFQNDMYGVSLRSSLNNKIIVNNISLSEKGIGISSSSNNNVIGNDLWNNGVGTSIFSSSSNNNIIENNITYNRNGISISELSNNSIKGNNFSFNNNAVRITSSSSINIIGNEFFSNKKHGVWLMDSSNIKLVSNNFTNDGILITGIPQSKFDSLEIPPNNTVNGKPLYYYKNCSGVDIDGIPVGQVILANCTDINITNVQISNTNTGIEVLYSNNINIMDNNISNNGDGIYSEHLSDSNIMGNDISGNNGSGIMLLQEQDNNIIKNNYISSNTDSGIVLSGWPSNNVIAYNSISNNDYGIKLFLASENLITNNNIFNNNYGIHLTGSSYNRIYYNNIVDNVNQAYDNKDTNLWNDTYPTGGNYWSDYSGVDKFNGPNQDILGNDGIGDTPYVIDADSIDEYPLIEPLTPSAPLNIQASFGDSYINITWEAPVRCGKSSVTHYRIYRGMSPENETFFMDIGNITYYNDTSVINGNIYYYMVSAVNSIGEGFLSNETSGTPAGIPSKPLDLIATVGEAYINITWTAPASNGGSPITNYKIYRGISTGKETFLIEIGNISYFNDTNITTGITYFYKVSAKNVVGEGPLSNEVSVSLGSDKDPPWLLWLILAIIICVIIIGLIVGIMFHRKKKWP